MVAEGDEQLATLVLKRRLESLPKGGLLGKVNLQKTIMKTSTWKKQKRKNSNSLDREERTLRRSSRRGKTGRSRRREGAELGSATFVWGNLKRNCAVHSIGTTKCQVGSRRLSGSFLFFSSSFIIMWLINKKKRWRAEYCHARQPIIKKKERETPSGVFKLGVAQLDLLTFNRKL